MSIYLRNIDRKNSFKMFYFLNENCIVSDVFVLIRSDGGKNLPNKATLWLVFFFLSFFFFLKYMCFEGLVRIVFGYEIV